MTDEQESFNPYAAPESNLMGQPGNLGVVKGKVQAPAIALIVVASLGLLASIINIIFALVVQDSTLNANLPEFLRAMQENARGPLTAVLQTVFLIMNAFILFGAIQMLRFRSWAWGLAASIIAIVDIGTCCCLIGLPMGIWSIITLASEDVKAAFRSASGR